MKKQRWPYMILVEDLEVGDHYWSEKYETWVEVVNILVPIKGRLSFDLDENRSEHFNPKHKVQLP